MFFMFFFLNMGSRNRGGKKYINFISSFSSNTINWNKKSPRPGRNPWPGLIDSTWRKIRPKNNFLPRQSVLFIGNLNKIVADHDGKL